MIKKKATVQLHWLKQQSQNLNNQKSYKHTVTYSQAAQK